MATVMPISLKPRAAERQSVLQLMNVEMFTRNTSVDWPTPLLSDEEIEYWAQRYEFYDLAKHGLRFILFMQCPREFLRRLA
jgi:hypothetical protein